MKRHKKEHKQKFIEPNIVSMEKKMIIIKNLNLNYKKKKKKKKKKKNQLVKLLPM
jgi:hypothetical protein